MFKTTLTKLRNGTIQSIRPATGVKMFVGAAEEYQIGASAYTGVAGSIAGTQLLGGNGCGGSE